MSRKWRVYITYPDIGRVFAARFAKKAAAQRFKDYVNSKREMKLKVEIVSKEDANYGDE